MDIDILRPRHRDSAAQQQLNLNYDNAARSRAEAAARNTQLSADSARRAREQAIDYGQSEQRLRSYQAAVGEAERLRARGDTPGSILRDALRDGGFDARPRPRGYQPTSPDRLTPTPPRALSPPRVPAPLPSGSAGSAALAIPSLLIEAAPIAGDAVGRLYGELTRPIPPSIPALQRLTDRLDDTLAENPEPADRIYDEYPVYYVSASLRYSAATILQTETVTELGRELWSPIRFSPGLVTVDLGDGKTQVDYIVTSHGGRESSRRANPVTASMGRITASSSKPISVRATMLGTGSPPGTEPFNPIAPNLAGNPQPANAPGRTQPAPQQRAQPPYSEPSIGRPGTQPSNPSQPGIPQQPNQPGVIPPAIPLIRPVGGSPVPQTDGGTPRPGGGRPTPRFPFPGGRAVGGSTGSAVNTGVENSIRTSTSSGVPATSNINACDAGGGNPCQVRLDRTTSDTNDRVRDLQDRLAQAGDVANAAANAAILAKLDIINAKLGPQIPGGGIASFIKKLWDSQLITKILNILTFVTVLHNAYMLSNNISQTLFSAFDTVLEFFGADLKNSEDEEISTSQWVGNAVEGFFNNIFGTETVNGIQANWKKFNRIYQAASNIVSSFQSMMYSVLESLEVVGNYVAQIGNAAKRFGVFADNCYRWMNPNNNFTTNRYFNALNNVQEAVENIDEVAGEALSIQQTGAELFTQKEALTAAVAEVIPGDTVGRQSNISDTPQHQPSSTFETKLLEDSQKVLIPIPDSAEVRQAPPNE